MKIEITEVERTLIVAAVIAYVGMDNPFSDRTTDLLARLSFADAANDGPEIEILEVGRIYR